MAKYIKQKITSCGNCPCIKWREYKTGTVVSVCKKTKRVVSVCKKTKRVVNYSIPKWCPLPNMEEQ